MALDFPASPTTGDRVTLNSVIYEYDGAKWVTIRSLFDRGQFVAGTAVEPGFSVSTDTNTGLYAPGADQLAFTTGGVERVEFGTSEVVFNDGGIDYDFRIEGDADVNLVFADASTDRIGIGTSAPSVKIDIEASEPYVTLKNTTEEDTDGGREVRIDFEGEQSGGEASTLARIEVSHDGAADDEKGKVVISTNDGADAATPTTAVTIDSEQKVTIAGDLETNTINALVYPDAGPLSNRNLIINGAMQVAQRGTSSTSSGINSVDRWYGIFDQGAVTQSQEAIDLADQPFTEDGLRNYFRLTNNTASTAAAAFRGFTQIIEAQNAATSGWNYTSSSSFITLSFWVRASVSQKFYGQLLTMDGTVQNYVFSFTPAANTWTKVVKTIPGNSNSQINLDNGEGIRVRIMPYWGTNFTDSGVAEDTWFAWTSGTRVPDMTTTWTNTAGATFDVTGVQLEVGSKATPFEHRGYGDELQRCQRYYQRFSFGSYGCFAPIGRKGGGGYTEHDLTIPHGPMRAAPSGNWLGDLVGFRLSRLNDAATTTPTAVTIVGTSDYTFTFRAWTASYSVSDLVAQWSTGNPSSQSYELIAEL